MLAYVQACMYIHKCICTCVCMYVHTNVSQWKPVLPETRLSIELHCKELRSYPLPLDNKMFVLEWVSHNSWRVARYLLI